MSISLKSLVLVDLHERSWVEKSVPLTHNRNPKVDLPERSWVEKVYEHIIEKFGAGRPPREVVSWKLSEFNLTEIGEGRPPREVVSWKICHLGRLPGDYVDLHERSWVEKRAIWMLDTSPIVDLPERSWVENVLQNACLEKNITDILIIHAFVFKIHIQKLKNNKAKIS